MFSPTFTDGKTGTKTHQNLGGIVTFMSKNKNKMKLAQDQSCHEPHVYSQTIKKMLPM